MQRPLETRGLVGGYGATDFLCAGANEAGMRYRVSQLIPRRRLLRGTLFVALGLLAVLAAAAARRKLIPAPNADEIWRVTELKTRAGKLAEAEAGLVRLQSLRRPTPEDWLLRAQVSAASGRDALALEAINHVPANHPLAGQAWLLAGRIERQKGRLRFAEAALRRAIELDPGLVQAHRELVYLFGVQLRRREVDGEFRAISRLTALSHHDLFTWCYTHFSTWAPDVSSDLERFVKGDPLDRHSRLALATLLLKSPGMEERVLRTLEPLPQSDVEATALRIELELDHGRVEQASALLQSAPEHEQRLARLRGRMALSRGEIKKAISNFRNALSEEPYERAALHDLGRALLLAGEKPEAERYLGQAKRLDAVYNLINRVRRPDAANLATDLSALADACAAAGLLSEARGWYLLVVERDPANTNAQQALWRLNKVPRDQSIELLPRRANVSIVELYTDSKPGKGGY
jgi:tetratricopeptide (TPR) repeat protein